MSRLTLADFPPTEPVIRLPHPYLTPYFASQAQAQTQTTESAESSSSRLYRLTTSSQDASSLADPLHSDKLFFSEPEDLKSSERPPESNNTAWARARRSPFSTILWHSRAAPTAGQVWLVVYVLFTIRPEEEFVRLNLAGPGQDTVSAQLRATMLAVNHPLGNSHSLGQPDELVLLRSTFWQGAGSPFGARSIWVPLDHHASCATPYATQAAPALNYVMTADPGNANCWHPRRPVKPRPGSVIYSRYIPHLKENFSMIALDYADPDHLQLFHAWQNDPRVSQGWNETGTLEQHREYCRRMHNDPHQFAVLAAFDHVPFAYFEIYWAKEDKLGSYYPSEDFDRGRHSLVGDVRYRGAHRVGAWWSSLMHYLYLDDPRTTQVVGEPKFTNSTVLAYDLVHGFSVDKFVDLPHKRSALMRCSRERFFQICPLAEDEGTRGKKLVGGTLVGLVPKL